jgi:hypothetical protein
MVASAARVSIGSTDGRKQQISPAQEKGAGNFVPALPGLSG